MSGKRSRRWRASTVPELNDGMEMGIGLKFSRLSHSKHSVQLQLDPEQRKLPWGTGEWSTRSTVHCCASDECDVISSATAPERLRRSHLEPRLRLCIRRCYCLLNARLTDHNCESGVLGSRSRRDGQHFQTLFVAELALLRAGRPADTFEEMDPSPPGRVSRSIEVGRCVGLESRRGWLVRVVLRRNGRAEHENLNRNRGNRWACPTGG
ncbi:hypothetical protein B0T13DRAFT_448819 [Neurospora crassa]|nr:hypothetical protein B0T13DRAFT_448819 [Neurospora crassa]